MIYQLMDIGMAIIFALPLLLITIKSKKETSKWWRWSERLMILNVLAMIIIFKFGELVWVMLFWQFLFIYPVSIILYIFLYSKDKTDYFIGLGKKQLILISAILVISLSAVSYGMFVANQDVKLAHQQFLEELIKAENPTEYLAYNVREPSTVMELPSQTKQLMNGNVRAVTFPWKSTVYVTDASNKKAWSQEFTYVRFYDDWVLEGSFNVSLVE